MMVTIANSLEAQRANFRRAGYVTVPTLIEPATASLLWTYLQARVNTGTLVDDGQVPGAPSVYGDPALEALLEWTRPRVEEISGLALYPTYSYSRLYRQGDTLSRHRDRPACEVSVSVCLGIDAAAGWPLKLHGALGPGEATLAPGDGLVYRGTEVEHWREPCAEGRHGQVFLHYVDQHGKNAEWRFDKRPSLRFCY